MLPQPRSLLVKAILAQLKQQLIIEKTLLWSGFYSTQFYIDILKSTGPGCLVAAGAQREYASSIKPYTARAMNLSLKNHFFCNSMVLSDKLFTNTQTI